MTKWDPSFEWVLSDIKFLCSDCASVTDDASAAINLTFISCVRFKV